MKNILITGGGGFIGKNLIEELHSTAHKIIVLDNFITSSEADFTTFLKQFPAGDIILYSYDITVPNMVADLSEKLAAANITTIHEIYHLASLASPPFYKKHPLETLDVGYIGTKNILEFAKQFGAKLLFSSTSEVYGDALVSPQHEAYYGNVNSFGERSSYDESKRVAEALCYTYIHTYGVDVKIARIFNTFGPHMLLDDGRIITEVIRHLKNGTTLTIYGDGSQTRSVCYVKDTVAMLMKLMASDVNVPVNIGNNEERTINDTVAIIEKVWNEFFGVNVVVDKVYKELTQNDPLQRRPCLNLNKNVLGEIEYTSFEEGLRRMIQVTSSV